MSNFEEPIFASLKGRSLKIKAIIAFFIVLSILVVFSVYGQDIDKTSKISNLSSLIWLELIIFMCFSAFFSCSETAIFSLSKVHILKIENSKKFGSESILKLLKDPKRTLNSILLGNLFVNIGASITAGIIAEQYIKGYPVLSFLVGAIGITIIILIFGETFPKALGLEKAETIVFFFSPVLRLVLLILYPFHYVLDLIINFFFKTFKIPPETPENALTEEEIKALLKFSDVRVLLEQDEKEMIESVIEFRETTAEEIMTPRTEIDCFPIDTPKEEIWEYIKKGKHNRLVIYEDDLDHIKGMLHIKDVILYPEKNIQDLLRSPKFIPPKKPLSALLTEFKQSRCHIAIVLDEYGGTAGIIALNDLLEEIVGEMSDQETETVENITHLSGSEFKILGKTEAWEFEAKFNIKLPEDMGRTMGGIVMNTLGHLPAEGEFCDFDFGQIKVTKMDRNRIKELNFKLAPEIKERVS